MSKINSITPADFLGDKVKVRRSEVYNKLEKKGIPSQYYGRKVEHLREYFFAGSLIVFGGLALGLLSLVGLGSVGAGTAIGTMWGIGGTAALGGLIMLAIAGCKYLKHQNKKLDKKGVEEILKKIEARIAKAEEEQKSKVELAQKRQTDLTRMHARFAN